MLGIFWLSSIPGDTEPQSGSGQGVIAWVPPALQNLLHVPMFGLLAWLWHWALRAWISRSELLTAAALGLAGGYGVLDELHQLEVAGRYASLTDLSLNLAGVGIALWAVHSWGYAKQPG